jgi:molybdopterin-containing oxidoreductase family iron-sulfur binding subunit
MRFTKGGNDISREATFDFLAQVGRNFTQGGGKGLAFLLQRSTSPSRARLVFALAQKFPASRWFVHEPVDFHVHQQAATIAAGKSVKPVYRLDQATVIVSLDADFIGSEDNTVGLCRDFAKGRKVAKAGDPMNRLYVLEALMTLTGANADHRLRLAGSQVLQAAALFAEKLLGQGGGDIVAAAKKAGALDEAKAAWVIKCAEDVAKYKGKSLFIAGHQQPLAVHLLAHALNSALGNVGTTVLYHETPDENFGSIADLARELNGNTIDTLVILGGNPAYDAPGDLNWAETQRKAKTIIR